MSDIAGLPMWVTAVIGVTILVAGAIGAVVLWRRMVRRYLFGLVGRREHARAARRTLEAIVRHLADETDEALLRFAIDSDAEDRKALSEVSGRMRQLCEELDVMPLPKSLQPAGEALADAAYVVAEEAGRLAEQTSPETVITVLGAIDLGRVAAQFDAAESILSTALEDHQLADVPVYGGGLYI